MAASVRICSQKFAPASKLNYIQLKFNALFLALARFWKVIFARNKIAKGVLLIQFQCPNKEAAAN